MKTFILALSLALSGLALQSCATQPSASELKIRAVAGQSLKSVGQTAEVIVTISAQLYADGRLTADQARAVNAFYDLKFQPAFRAAVAALKLDSKPSTQEVIDLANQLAALVASYQKGPP